MTQTATGRRARRGSRAARGIAILVGAFYMLVGLWAFLVPAGTLGGHLTDVPALSLLCALLALAAVLELRAMSGRLEG